MKKLFYITAVLFGLNIQAQVAIGTGAKPSTPAVSIEFGTAAPAENKGVILPWVTNAANMTTAVVGTLVFDSATQKVKLATSSTPTTASTPTSAQSVWMDLSNGAAAPATPFVNPVTARGEAAAAKVIVGAPTSVADGILVLETPNADVSPKAMVLPRVNLYTDIANPSAGMIVYVKTNKRLAVFNGKEWAFWTTP